MRFQDFYTRMPEKKFLPKYDPKLSTAWHGIKALWYEGAVYQGKRTKVFAYIGYPKECVHEKMPAIVLVHGGTGHAFAEWIRRWNEKGFVAIAMDTTGFFPKGKWAGLVGNEQAEDADKYERCLNGPLKEAGYTVGPDNSEMQDYNQPLKDQWMYHAVADTILAHNILLEDERVDGSRIGICGISWGAVITSIAIGYDTRYAFAIPIYGSAFLDYLPAPTLPQIFRHPKVKEQWSASERLDKVHFPVLWQCWSYDSAFSLGANSMSYEATREANAVLSISQDMGHCHASGWNTPEGYRFAKKVLQGKEPFVKTITEWESEDVVRFEVRIPNDFTKVVAKLFYLTEPVSYDENNEQVEKWRSLDVSIQNNQVQINLPTDTYCYFLEFKGFVNELSYISDTKIMRRKGKKT